MANDLYVCYSSHDKAAADAACAALEAGGLRCWIAPRDVPPGAAWAEAIYDAIAKSRALLLIFSFNGNQSAHMKHELERAVQLGIPVISLRIDATAPAATLELFVGNSQWIDASTPPLEKNLERLVEAANELLSNKQPRLTPRPTEFPPPVKAEHYDVFISYRRESGAAEARLIRAELREKGVRAFLDVDDLKAGHFDEALLTRIADAPNFIVILSQHSLDRCADKRDWLRQEIAQAVKTGRTIIPILLRGFEFPETESLPDDLKALPMHNGLEYSHKYFNAMIADILTYLRTEDSLDSPGTESSAAEATAIGRARLETKTAAPGLSFTGLVEDPDSLISHKLGRYVIKGFIGAGGSGLVYRALQTTIGQDVCVKIFYPLMPEGPDVASIAARGARGLAAMNHPHIIKVFDLETLSLSDGSSFYLVMELVRGRRLDEWSSSLAESDSTVAARAQMALDVTRALAAAHSCRYIDELGFEQTGILHGDIKPGNIIVRADNSPVVLDFMMLDVQRLLDSRVVPPSLLRGRRDEPITAAYGTPGFMAPEQDRYGIVTVKSDIYGFGVTLAHLFFPGSDNPLYALSVSEQDMRLNGVRSLVEAMVAEDPDARPRDMLEVARHLKEWSERLAGGAEAETGKGPAASPMVDPGASPARESSRSSAASTPAATTEPTSSLAVVPPAVKIISPCGGEKWQSGTTQSIKWTASSEGAAIKSIRIELHQRGGNVLNITELPSHLPGNAVVFRWTIPASLGATDDCRVKVVALDKLGREGYGISSAGFSITKMSESDKQVARHGKIGGVVGAAFWGGLAAIVGVSEFGSQKGGVKSPVDLIILLAIGVLLGGLVGILLATSRKGRLWGIAGILAGLILGAVWGDAEGFVMMSLLFGLFGSLFGAVLEARNRKHRATKT